MHHFNKTRKKYKKQYKDETGCPFCEPLIGQRERIAETAHFVVVENNVAYDLWEGHTVTEHLMVIPKKHVEKLADLSSRQKAELVNILSEYEGRGYNVYARGAKGPRRSVEHQHTHLIKIGDNGVKALLLIAKPYFLFKI